MQTIIYWGEEIPVPDQKSFQEKLGVSARRWGNRLAWQSQISKKLHISESEEDAAAALECEEEEMRRLIPDEFRAMFDKKFAEQYAKTLKEKLARKKRMMIYAKKEAKQTVILPMPNALLWSNAAFTGFTISIDGIRKNLPLKKNRRPENEMLMEWRVEYGKRYAKAFFFLYENDFDVFHGTQKDASIFQENVKAVFPIAYTGDSTHRRRAGSPMWINATVAGLPRRLFIEHFTGFNWEELKMLRTEKPEQWVLVDFRRETVTYTDKP